MSDFDDRDLSAAFEELHAPPSTAGYATRTPGFDVPSATRSRNWPQALAGVLAVAVAVAGAGTFLALRSARQGAGPAASGANPPARFGAAMAYDSSAGVTVMYGGTDGAGKQLTDTWTWDGSAWTAAAKGPGPLADVRMVDDPAGSGVLLVGLPAPKVTGGSGGAVGCVSGGTGTGTANPGSAAGGATPKSYASTGASIAQSLPASGTPAVAPAPVGTPLPTCPPAAAAPSEQTWLFSSQGWRLAWAGSTATTPVAGSQLTFDPTTRQVVAVSSNFFGCGPPLESPGSSSAILESPSPAIACPALGTSSKAGASAALGVPCNAASGCLGYGTTSTWTWSGRSWKQEASATLQASGLVLLFTDPATGHATLMSQAAGSTFCPHPLSGAAIACPIPATPLPAAQTTTWSWTGSGWGQVSRVPDMQQVPSVAGASVAAAAGHILVLTTAGQTWTFATGQWTQETVADHPSTRSGASMAEGPSGTVVLFGGTAGGGYAVPASGTSSSSSGATGSDTWVWNGSAWKHVAGTTPSPPPTPTACPDVVSLQPKCVGPPTRVLPTAPAGTVLPEAGGTPSP
jgi:hypothetical protein